MISGNGIVLPAQVTPNPDEAELPTNVKVSIVKAMASAAKDGEAGIWRVGASPATMEAASELIANVARALRAARRSGDRDGGA